MMIYNVLYSGNALASILFGDVNPSGKLPLTFPVQESDLPIKTKAQYPGINNQTTYSEKLLVGYRWYDATNTEPLFPFGHGLSYTSFNYSNLQILSSYQITFDLTNTGKYDGAEVAQLYLQYPESAGEPPRVLRGFKKIFLKQGETQKVEFVGLEEKPDLSIWDVSIGDWKVINGVFKVFVGSSSRDHRLSGDLVVGQSA